jgi:hypothetical protein
MFQIEDGKAGLRLMRGSACHLRRGYAAFDLSGCVPETCPTK